jgi:hypothetical protein
MTATVCFKNKKGNLAIDTLTVIIILLVFSTTSIFAYMFYSDFNADMQSDPDISDNAKIASADINNKLPTLLDNLFVWIIILLWIGIIITTYLIDTNPAFFVIVVILLLLVLIVGMDISNFYAEFIADSDVSLYVTSFPMTTWMMNNLLYILIGMSFSAGVTLYAKQQ